MNYRNSLTNQREKESTQSVEISKTLIQANHWRFLLTFVTFKNVTSTDHTKKDK